MAAPQNLRQIAVQDARKYGVPANVFVRQIQQESGFNANAKSGAGAEGIAQFMPATAAGMGLTDPYNPVASLDAAARLDASQIKRYGSVAAALSAYNSGSPTAYKDPNFAHGQTYNYVRDILGGAGEPAAAAPVSHAVGQTLAAPAVRPPAGADNLGTAGNLGAALKLLGFDAGPRAPVAPHATQTAPVTAPQPGSPVRPQPMGTGQVVGATKGEQAAFLNDLAKLAAFEHAPVDINSGYRSMAEQQQLWNNRASNPNPVAAPGTSLHEQGLAADGTIGGKPLGTLPAAILRRFGLASVPGDSVHVQVAR